MWSSVELWVEILTTQIKLLLFFQILFHSLLSFQDKFSFFRFIAFNIWIAQFRVQTCAYKPFTDRDSNKKNYTGNFSFFVYSVLLFGSIYILIQLFFFILWSRYRSITYHPKKCIYRILVGPSVICFYPRLLSDIHRSFGFFVVFVSSNYYYYKLMICMMLNFTW